MSSTIVNPSDFLKGFTISQLIVDSGALANYKYIGFDVNAIRNALINKNITTGDMGIMVYLFLTRGNNITAMKKKTGSLGVASIGQLENEYGLVSKIKGKGSNAINLARVAAICPPAVLEILKNTDASDFRPVTHAELTGLISGYPKWLCTILFVSTLPAGEDFKSKEDHQRAIGSFILYAALENKRLNPTRSVDFRTSVAEVKRYIEAASRSNLMTRTERFEFSHKNFGELITPDGGKFRTTELCEDIFSFIQDCIENNSFPI